MCVFNACTTNILWEEGMEQPTASPFFIEKYDACIFV